MAITHVAHPAFLRCVLAGEQSERCVHTRVVTPVELREASARELTPAAYVHSHVVPSELFMAERCRIPIHEHGGSLWHPVFLEQAEGEPQRALVGVRAFRTYLESGKAHLSRPSRIEHRFAATPLSPTRFVNIRASDFDEGTIKTMIEDGRPRASQDLARFMEENVLIVDGKLFARVVGPMVYVDLPWGMAHRQILATGNPIHKFSVEPAERNWDTFPCRADRFARFFELHLPEPTRKGMAGPWLERIDQHLDGAGKDFPWHLAQDDDIRLSVGALADLADKDADVAISRGVRRGTKVGPLPELRAHLHHYMALGGIGALRDDEVEPGLVAVRAFLQAVFETHPHTMAAPKLVRLARHIDEFALPVWRNRPVARALPSPEDDEALAGLSL